MRAPLIFAVLVITCSACTAAPPKEQGQPPLPTVQLKIGAAGATLTAEIAATPEQGERGLMFRKSLAPDTGMLFLLPRPGPLAFWMRNTQIPLSVAYFGKDGTIWELHDLEPLNETPVPGRRWDFAGALEVPRGWFQKKEIGIGAKIVPQGKSWAELRAMGVVPAGP